MANQWFRLYAEFATDPKVQMMSEADQRRFIMVLCIRCSNDDVTFQDEEIAFQLRISSEDWARSKAVFLQKGLIHEDNTPVAWDKRQFVSDSSAERVRRHRAAKKKAGKQPCNVTETAPEADTDSETEKPLSPSSVVDISTAVAPEEPQPAALPADRPALVVEPEQTRRGTVCRMLRAAGISDAAPHHLADGTWALILAKRTDEEIVEFARAKQASRPGQRTGLKYLAPGLLEDPTPIAVPTTGARASPRGMTREQGRAIAASTRLSDFRAACAAEQGLNDERTIEAPAAPRQLG